ncbi:hypothetical protein ABH968_003695 [Lysinibacillus sp. RC79]
MDLKDEKRFLRSLIPIGNDTFDKELSSYTIKE